MAGDPLNFEALGFRPIEPIGKSGTGQPSFMYIDFVVRKSKNNKLNKYDDITYIFRGDYIKDGTHIVLKICIANIRYINKCESRYV